MRIERYADDYEQDWDDFVLNKSVNGTFLHTRRFLNYHTQGKFEDYSLLFFDKKDSIVAVCPSCVLNDGIKKQFYSHKGATYGGLVINFRYYKAKYVVPLVAELERFLRKERFHEIYLKITPRILSLESPALLEYALYQNNYTEYKELNPYINLDLINSGNAISFLSQGKRTHVHKLEREGVEVHSIHDDSDIKIYYGILCENLKKYGVTPVHALGELLSFKNNRLKDECGFFGVYLDRKMVAGGMLFYFHNSRTAHTQYLSSKTEYVKVSPVTYLYYWLILEMKKRGYRNLSWGICTEDYGRYLNEGLISSKEDFGSTYDNNLTYFKSIKRGGFDG